MMEAKLKPLQARGLWGPRHIHKKVLELPIPQFDPLEEAHRKLAELGRACTQKVADWLEAGGPGKVRSIGKLRSMVRGMLAEELGEINGLVSRKIMGLGAGEVKVFIVSPFEEEDSDANECTRNLQERQNRAV